VSLIAKPWKPASLWFVHYRALSTRSSRRRLHGGRIPGGRPVAWEASYCCGCCRNCRPGLLHRMLELRQPAKGHRANALPPNGGFAQYAVNHINTRAHKYPIGVNSMKRPHHQSRMHPLRFQTVGGYVVGDSVASLAQDPWGWSLWVWPEHSVQENLLVGTRASRLQMGKTMRMTG